MSQYRALSTAFFAVAVLIVSSGCLVATSKKQTQSGNYVAESTFDQIEPGTTSSAWVRATLGEPSDRTKVDNTVEVWKWTYTQTKKSSGAIFLIFGGEETKESTGNAFVEFKDGVVTRKWRT